MYYSMGIALMEKVRLRIFFDKFSRLVRNYHELKRPKKVASGES